MAVTDLWLVRHGESVANIAATRAEREGLERIPIDIRDADVPLSPTGREQAQALSTWWAANRDAVDVCWVSPYRRARETLAIARGDDDDHAAAIVDERLRDRELGILDLLTRRGVEHLHPEEADRRRHLGKFYHRPPGGESWADVALRLRSFLRDELPRCEGGGLIVAHDAVVMILLYLLLPLEEAELLDFAASHTVLNASVTQLTRDDESGGWRLAEFAGVGHLQVEGAPVTVHPGNPDVEPE
ncbi:histidine phosphatase family protein [Microbacterium sp. 4R-513]|uniref:histidine phosphatase family protein n=1 Tax=Microbacterium sp. 4R-513 TaxID=2567934 RepID=UPI0013E158DD|nr:histidine phosphatase family protein [Microbacterium sp. 4R-513]QIG38723.1 histidine phosphatase family protein [Microbacterium sp. 4R-513]